MPLPPKRFSKPTSSTPTPRVPAPVPEAPAKTVAATPSEPGWLPDCVYTGEKFETGLAFFADALGRITRFSREPKDLAMARRLAGQAALPGLVNVHSVSWQRLLRGRTEGPARTPAEPLAAWTDLLGRTRAQLSVEDVFETARMAFTEMLLSGIVCVGEFHDLRLAEGKADPNATAEAILRAAHEVGIRIGLLPVAAAESADSFVRETEQLRVALDGRYPADEAWLGVGVANAASLSLDAMKVIAAYAHAQRFRLQARLALTPADAAAAVARHGKPAALALLDAGVVDKRFTAVHGLALTEEECRVLGTARAGVCLCPGTEQNWGLGLPPVERLVTAGAALSLGTSSAAQIDLLKEARALEYGLRRQSGRRPAFAPDSAKALFHAATVAGARSLGATGGALEVGRPADFFTVNLYEPSIAGADPETLLANVVFALERRAIREVWIGARQRITGGRHPNQGLTVGRFVELQRRLWGAAPA